MEEEERRLLSNRHHDDAGFHHNRQEKLPFFAAETVGWVLTVTFLLLFLATLKLYERKGNFPSEETIKFNGITNARTIINWSIATQGGFQGLAKVLRWKLLHEKNCTKKEADLILGINSLSKVFQLGWESRLKPFTLLFCIVWVFLNLLIQVPVGLLSLTFSVDGGTDYNGTYIKDGVVHASNLACYFSVWIPECPSSAISPSLANSYGKLALDTPCCPYNDISEVYNSRLNCKYYCQSGDDERRNFVYRFLEYNPDDTQRTYPVFTNRTITTSTGTCFKYNITNDPVPGNRQENTDDLIFQYSNGTVNGNITIPGAFWAGDATTYIYRGTDIPEEDNGVSCGPRCLWIWAYKSKGTANLDHETALYQCPITVSSVTNTTNHTQEIPNSVARLAASSISLQGRSVITKTGGKDWTQFQFFPFGSFLEIHDNLNDSIVLVGPNMAEFAMRSIVKMIESNRQILVNGSTPYLGNHLTINWRYVIFLCAYIAGMHLLLVISAVYATTNVFIQKDSNLSIVKVMFPLIEEPDLRKDKSSHEEEEHFTYGIVRETGVWGMYPKKSKDIPLERIAR